MSNVFRRVKILDEKYKLEAPAGCDFGAVISDKLFQSEVEKEFVFSDEEEGAEYPVKEEILREEAAKIITDAEEERNHILENAQKEALAYKEKGYEEGYREGQEAGQDAGRELMRENDQKREERFSKLLASIHRERERLLWEAEGELLNLSIEISRQVVLSELKVNREVILEIVRGGLRRLTNKQGLVIRVSPEDKSIILEHKDELQSGEDLLTLTIVGDPQLKQGDCFLETTSGSVDGRLETRLSEARKLLNKRYEAFGTVNDDVSLEISQ